MTGTGALRENACWAGRLLDDGRLSPGFSVAAPATCPVALRARIRRCRLPTASPVLLSECEEAVMRAVGLDVHLDFCEVAIVEDGEVRSAGRIETKPEQIELFARSLGPDDRVALEVTGNAWEIARIIEPHVAQVLVVSPSDTGIRQARAKTDRLDARTLARLLAAGSLDAVWMPDRATWVMRRRLSRRGQLVWARSRAKNQIHAVLMRQLVGRPPVSDLFGVKGREVARRARAAARGARDGRRRDAPDRVPRLRDRRGRAADRPGSARVGGDQAADERARGERDRRRELPGGDR